MSRRLKLEILSVEVSIAGHHFTVKARKFLKKHFTSGLGSLKLKS
jgi:hypothetical protein